MMIPRIVTQYLPVYHHLPSLHPFISAIVVYMPGYNTCTSMSWCSPRVSISGTMFMCLTVELSNSAPSIVVFVVHMLTVGCTQNVWCSHILVVENKGLMRYSQGSHFFMLVIAQILGGGLSNSQLWSSHISDCGTVPNHLYHWGSQTVECY